MLLKQTLKALIDLNGIEKVDETIAEIFDDRMKQAKTKEEGELMDFISYLHDECHRLLLVRPFTDEIRNKQ
jgi:hypothetical protein